MCCELPSPKTDARVYDVIVFGACFYSERLLRMGLADLVLRAITACPRNAAIQGAAAQLLVWLLSKDPTLGS